MSNHANRGSASTDREDAPDADPRVRNEVEGAAMDEDMPDILEIFGAAPLVQDPSTRFDLSEPGGDDLDDAETPPAFDLDAIEAEASSPDEEAPTTTPAADEALRALGALRRGQKSVQAGMKSMASSVEGRIAGLEEVLASLTKQTSFLPPKLRGLGQKVAELSSSLADSRCHDLLEDVVILGDLVDGALGAFPPGRDDPVSREARRYFEAFATRIAQVIESNKLTEIPTDGAFDPTMHHATSRVQVDDPDLHGVILEVYRRGFRTNGSVLRYAEVAVGRHEAPEAGPGAETAEPEGAWKGNDVTTISGPGGGASGEASSEGALNDDKDQGPEGPDPDQDTD